tara:strand:+ start:1969 stop:2874 length:906 start_codon:yes stop_codon:yes gene_type:complete
LKLHVIDLVDDGVAGDVRLDLRRAEGGSAGAGVTATFPLAGEAHLELEDIPCQSGYGTTYTVAVTTKHFRRFAFNQLIRENRANRANESPLRLVAKPKAVQDIQAPAFSKLPARRRTDLGEASMLAHAEEDGDLVGLSGPQLYSALGPLRTACLLNIYAKAGHASADRCGRFIGAPLVLRQDRCFCMIDDAMPEFLNNSARFISAPGALHEPLPGFRMVDISYKSRDSHANLQVTIMQKIDSGELAADIDIDEATGFRHGMEVIRNHVGRQRTNPYLVRELLLLRDPVGKSLNPKYRFVFT